MAWDLGFGIQKRSVKAAFAFICPFLVFPAFSSTNGAFWRRKKDGMDHKNLGQFATGLSEKKKIGLGHCI